jgi:hypothetical protein
MWQPIETAPKEEGKLILVRNHDHFIEVDWKDGWRLFGKAKLSDDEYKFTHWMPLLEDEDEQVSTR